VLCTLLDRLDPFVLKDKRRKRKEEVEERK
jgi:hypothetical protein